MSKMIDNSEKNWCLNMRNVGRPLILRSKYKVMPHNAIYSDSAYSSLSECNCQRSENNIRELAGLKLFSIITVNSWRKCKREMQRTLKILEDLNRNNLKNKNKLEMYNQLLRKEQQRNDELSNKLKKSLYNLNKVKTSYESIKSKLINIKADKTFLEQEIKVKNEEYDALQVVMSQTKTDLFRCMVDQRNLQELLCKEQKTIQSLQLQKRELIKEISLLSSETQNIEKNYMKIIYEKEQEIINTKNKICVMQAEINELKEQTAPVNGMAKSNGNLRIQLAHLHDRINDLKLKNHIGFYNKCHSIYRQLILYPNKAFNMAHVFCYYLIPATPPPLSIILRQKQIANFH